MIYLIFILSLIILYSFNKKGTFKNYSIADKSISFPLLLSSLMATYIGPGFTLGFIGDATKYGFFMFIFFTAYGIQTYLSGKFVYPKLQEIKGVYSFGELISHKFDKSTQLMTGLVSLSLMVAFSSIMIAKGGSLLSSSIGLGLGRVESLSLFTIIVLAYSINGGIKASIVSDLFQFIFFFVVFVLIFLVIISLNPNIPESLNIAQELTLTKISNTSTLTMIALFISTGLGEAFVPPYINRALSGISKSAVSRAFKIGGIIFVFWSLLMALIGIFTMNISDIIPLNSGNSDNTLIVFVQSTLSEKYSVLLSLALILVFMSTFDSFLNSGSIIFSKDIVETSADFFNLKKTNLYQTSKFGVLLISFVSVYLSYYIGGVISALLYAYSIWAPSMVPIVIYTILGKRHNKIAAKASIIVGILSSMFLKFYIFTEIDNLPMVTFFGLIISTSTLVSLHYLLKLKSK